MTFTNEAANHASLVPFDPDSSRDTSPVEDRIVNRHARRFPLASSLFDRLSALRDRFARVLSPRSARSDSRTRLSVEAMEERLVPDSRPLPDPTIFVGTDAGQTATVSAYAADTGTLKFSVPVYGSHFTGGVRLATADFTGDGIPDVVLAPGAGRSPRIEVLDGTTGKPIAGPLSSFLAYGSGADKGVFVATGDVNGDGHADIITATLLSSAPKIEVFSGVDGSQIASFSVPGAAFAHGLTIASADLTNDGRAEVVVGSATNGQIRTYNPLTGTIISGPLGSFRAFGPGYSGGVFLGADSLSGDVNGDNRPDLVVGSASGIARARVFDGVTGESLYDFKPFGNGVTGGAQVALAYVDDDSHADIVVGTGSGPTDAVSVFSGATGEQLAEPMGSYTPFGSQTGGVFVAAANDPSFPTVTFTTAPGSAVLDETKRAVVTVTGSASPGTPTGTVTFSAMPQPSGTGIAMGSVTLVSDGSGFRATATLDFSSLPVGSYAIIASYGGDSNYASGSGNTMFTVSNPASGTPPVLAPGANSSGTGPVRNPFGNGLATRGGMSVGGVDYGTGNVSVTRSDLSADGFGTPWGQTWDWTNASGYSDGTSGSGATQTQVPHLVQENGDDSIAMVSNAGTANFFDSYGGTYHERFGGAGSLTHDTTNHLYVLADGTGQTFTFYDFSASTPTGRKGKLKSMTDANGDVTSVTSWDGSGRPTEVQQTTGSGSSTLTNSFVSTYVASGVNAGLLDTVTERTQVGTGSWTTVRSTAYTYYDGMTGPGLAGELKLAVVKDAGGNTIDTNYYRYYTSGTGTSGKLKYIWG